MEAPIQLLSRKIDVNRKVIRHAHPWGQLIYASEGVFSVEAGGDHFVIPNGQSMWVPADVPHSVAALSPIQLDSLYISIEEACELPNEVCLLRVDLLTRLLILKAKGYPQSLGWLSKRGRLLRSARDILSDSERIEFKLPMPSDRRLLQIVSKLQQDSKAIKSLSDGSQSVGASERTLARVFKKETGVTFVEWKRRLNVQKAVNMLDQGQSINEIAFELGYETPSAFIHMFKKYMGQSPGKYAGEGEVP